MRASLAALTAVVALASTAAQAETFTCPSQVETDATSGGLPQSFKFRYVSFFDGDPADLADLAPDDGPNPQKLEQRWEFTRTKGRPIIMICRYHGTDMTVRRDVPPQIKECRLDGVMDGKGEVQGSPTLTCK
jgi:hypothetical protein